MLSEIGEPWMSIVCVQQQGAISRPSIALAPGTLP
jgi:hypothetical protein